MKVQDLLNALTFLRKTHVGKLDEDAFFATIQALEDELVKEKQRKVA